MRNKAFYKNRKPIAIGEVLKKVIGDLEAPEKTEIKSIDIILKGAAPRKLINHMKMQRKLKEKLIIHVDSSTWLYEAHKYKSKILKAIQQKQESSGIKELLFRVGNIK